MGSPVVPNTPTPVLESPQTPTGTLFPSEFTGSCPLLAGSNPVTLAMMWLLFLGVREKSHLPRMSLSPCSYGGSHERFLELQISSQQPGFNAGRQQAFSKSTNSR